MDTQPSINIDLLLAELNSENKAEAIARLSGMDDAVLWSVYKKGCEEALVILFKKYHRQIVVLVYGRLSANSNISLALVQDAFGEFVEKILTGHYKSEDIEKNFTAFSVHHLSYLVRSRARSVANSRVQGLEGSPFAMKLVRPHLRVEENIDYRKVIDLIPNVTNKVYRKVLWLIFILGYNSEDLAEVFGERAKAYDKRSRAMKAFRELLDKEGLLDELR